jgi:hypothetical protein
MRSLNFEFLFGKMLSVRGRKQRPDRPLMLLAVRWNACWDRMMMAELLVVKASTLEEYAKV